MSQAAKKQDVEKRVEAYEAVVHQEDFHAFIRDVDARDTGDFHWRLYNGINCMSLLTSPVFLTEFYFSSASLPPSIIYLVIDVCFVQYLCCGSCSWLQLSAEHHWDGAYPYGLSRPCLLLPVYDPQKFWSWN